MRNINIRPTVESDIPSYWKKPEIRFKSWTLEYNKEIFAIAGVYYDNNDNIVAFSDIIEEKRPPKLVVFKSAQLIVDLIMKENENILALCTNKYENSGKMLRKLGFNFLQRDGDVEIYFLTPIGAQYG